MCLFYKRIEKGSFTWPAAKDGKVSVTAAQLMSLLEGMDWRLTRAAPEAAQPTRIG
jgi:transposase